MTRQSTPTVRTLFGGDGRESGVSPSGGRTMLYFLGGKLRNSWLACLLFFVVVVVVVVNVKKCAT